MCGIAGIVDWGGRDAPPLAAALERMDRAVAMRGPDGEGRVTLPGGPGVSAMFAHRRLAILDRTEAGRQPMSSADGRHWVTFNGELYNFKDLQAPLRDAGVELGSESDTEVLVEYLAREGRDAVSRFRGMFAFASWDTTTGRLTLGRDRFGIKPLVFVRPEPDLLLFASTPQALAASGLCRLRPAPGARAEFLAHGSVPAHRSFWDGVQVVAPGTTVVVQGASADVRSYYAVESRWRQPDVERPLNEVASPIRTAIEDSVAAHLVSDVPVAVFLSGGLDSAVIAASAQAHAGGGLHSFTVTMPGSGLDEGAAARETAAACGLTHTDVALGELDRDQLLDEFFAAMVQPTVDGLNTFVVGRAASMAGVRVALTGVGGDELFGGYPSFVDVPRLFRVLQPWGPLIRAGAAWWPGNRSRADKLGAIVREAPRSLDDVWWAYRGIWSRADAERLSGESVSTRASGAETSPFNVIRDLEWRQFLERQLLPDADAFTMCRALELRTPLVDHLVVDAVAGAGRWRTAPGLTSKATLFSAWPDWVTPAVLRRKKQGFVLPIDQWLRTALSEPGPRVWADVKARLAEPPYDEVVRQFLSGRLHWSRVWSVYVLARLGDLR
jgi:asparagine synthase (glutamine-hydrolysing)